MFFIVGGGTVLFADDGRTPPLFAEDGRTPSLFVEDGRTPSLFVEDDRTSLDAFFFLLPLLPDPWLKKLD